MTLVVEPDEFADPVAVGFFRAVSQVASSNECPEAIHKTYRNGR